MSKLQAKCWMQLFKILSLILQKLDISYYGVKYTKAQSELIEELIILAEK